MELPKILRRGTPKNGFFTASELTRLQKLPRYTPFSTYLFNRPIWGNDACTLLSDVREILRKEVYRFETENTPVTILDCGSNIGMSVIYFKSIFPQAQIRAFEADPILFSLLEKNLSSFSLSNVKAENKAVWIHADGVYFSPEGGHSGAITDSNNNQGKNIEFVSSVRLKSILENYEQLDMLKIDIEGAEEEVIFDCGEALKRCRNIFVEYHSKAFKPQKLHTILELFSNYGYRYHIQEAYTRKRPFVDKECLVGHDLQLNLFFYNDDLEPLQ